MNPLEMMAFATIMNKDNRDNNGESHLTTREMYAVGDNRSMMDIARSVVDKLTASKNKLARS